MYKNLFENIIDKKNDKYSLLTLLNNLRETINNHLNYVINEDWKFNYPFDTLKIIQNENVSIKHDFINSHNTKCSFVYVDTIQPFNELIIIINNLNNKKSLSNDFKRKLNNMKHKMEKIMCNTFKNLAKRNCKLNKLNPKESDKDGMNKVYSYLNNKKNIPDKCDIIIKKLY